MSDILSRLSRLLPRRSFASVPIPELGGRHRWRGAARRCRPCFLFFGLANADPQRHVARRGAGGDRVIRPRLIESPGRHRWRGAAPTGSAVVFCFSGRHRWPVPPRRAQPWFFVFPSRESPTRGGPHVASHGFLFPRGGRGGQDHRGKGKYYISTSPGKSRGIHPPHSETGRGRPRGRRLDPKPKALAVSNVHPYVPECDPGIPIVE